MLAGRNYHEFLPGSSGSSQLSCIPIPCANLGRRVFHQVWRRYSGYFLVGWVAGRESFFLNPGRRKDSGNINWASGLFTQSPQAAQQWPGNNIWTCTVWVYSYTFDIKCKGILISLRRIQVRMQTEIPDTQCMAYRHTLAQSWHILWSIWVYHGRSQSLPTVAGDVHDSQLAGPCLLDPQVIVMVKR